MKSEKKERPKTCDFNWLFFILIFTRWTYLKNMDAWVSRKFIVFLLIKKDSFHLPNLLKILKFVFCHWLFLIWAMKRHIICRYRIDKRFWNKNRKNGDRIKIIFVGLNKNESKRRPKFCHLTKRFVRIAFAYELLKCNMEETIYIIWIVLLPF